MRVLGPEEAARVMPGLQASSLPAVMGLVIGVESLDATRAALAGVLHAEVPGGVMVPAAEAGGCALLFAA